MLEGFVVGLVEKYVTPYADVDPQKLCVAAREGNVVLKDLKLKPAAFDALEFPLTVKSGSIGELSVAVSWSALRASPAKVFIKDVFVTVGPSNAEADSTLKAERLKQEVADDLRDDEEARILRVKGASPPTLSEQSFAIRLFSAAVSTLHVSIANVHVRYEDCTSNLENAFAGGITLDKLEFVTTDAQFRPADKAASLEGIVHKLLQVSGLSMYWQHSVDPWTGPPVPGEEQSGRPYHVIHPLSAELRLGVNGNGQVTNGAPRITGDLAVQGSLQVCLDCATMRDVASVVDAAVVNANRARVSIARPTVGYKQGPAAWWKFAIKCVQEEVGQRRAAAAPSEVLRTGKLGRSYLPLFKRKMLGAMGAAASLSAEEEAEMRRLEEELPLQAVMALRGRAEEMVDAEGELKGAGAGKPNGEGGGGVFGRLLSGWRREGGKASKEVIGVELEVGEAELLEVCCAESEGAFQDLAGPGALDPRYRLALQLPALDLQLCDRLANTGPALATPNRSIARVLMSGWAVELVGKPGVQEGAFGLPIALQLSLASIEMYDHVTAGTAFPKVMEMAGSSSACLSLRVEDQPPNSPASYLVRVELASPRMVYSPPLVARCSQHVAFVNQVDMRGVTALVSRKAAAGVEQQRLLTQRLIRHAVEERRPVDWQLKLALPDVVVPQSLLAAEPSSSKILFRGGALTAVSEVQAEGGGAYDLCSLAWKGIGVWACAGDQDCFAGAGEQMLVVDEATCEFQVLVNRNDMSHTQLVIKQSIPAVHLTVSSSSLRRFTAVSVAVTSGSNPVPAPNSLEAHEVSTLVSLASSTLSVLEQAWDTMRRREIGMLRSLQGDKDTRLRKYADWNRVSYELAMGELSVGLVDKGTAGSGEGQELIRVKVRGHSVKALVRSLDATVEVEVKEMEIADLAQEFGESWGLLLGNRVSSSGRGAEAVVWGSIQVWNQKSPDRQEVDVEMKATVGQVYVGCNLQTLAKVQNCVAVALEQGLQGLLPSNAPALNGEAPPPQEDAVAVQVKAAAAGLEMAGTKGAVRKLALRFAGEVHAVDVSLYTERGESVFQVALLEVREYRMTNQETRRGRIEVEAQLQSLRLLDMTPQAGDKYTKAVEALAGSMEEGREGVAYCRYVHFGRGEKEATDAVLEGSAARLAVVASPRFIAELVTYVHRSAVFRSNFAAITKVLANTARFRQRMDAAAFAYGYRIALALRVGGLQVLCPEASTSDNCIVLDIPQVTAANNFTEEGERAVENIECQMEAIRLISRIGGEEQSLIAFTAKCSARRQLKLAATDADSELAVLQLTCEVGHIEVTVAQAQVALFWRAVFHSIAEVKTAWACQGHSRKVAFSKSVLDIAPIREALAGAAESAAVAERERQASSARASRHSLDLEAEVRFHSLSITIAKPTAPHAPQARLEVSGVAAAYRNWSDTSYAAQLLLKSVRLLDVDEDSANVHKVLLEPYDADKELVWCKYMESSDCDGDLNVEFSGVKVNVAADPIFGVLATVFNAFSTPTATGEGEGDGNETESQSVKTTPLAEEAQGGWGESCMQARLVVGPCQLTVLQDCAAADCGKMVLSMAAVGSYWGSSEEEKATCTVADLQLYSLTAELPEPLHILDRTNISITANRLWGLPAAEGGDAKAPSACVQLLARTLDLVVTYQDLKRLFATVKVFQAAMSKSGFATSTGVQWIASMMEREDEDAVSAPPAAAGFWPCPTTFEVRSDVISLCLINDCLGWTVPFATATAKSLQIDVLMNPDMSINTTAQVSLEASFYNIMNTCFEPIMEPWTLKVEMTESPGRVHGQTKISADSRIEFNISEMHMRGVVQTVESWLQDSKTWGEALEQGKFSPYRLRNEAGVPLTFWLGSSLEPPDPAVCKDLASGGEEPFQFSQKRVLQARQRDMSIEFHTLSIRFEGIVDVLTHVPVDITGVHMLPLGELRAVAEIHNDSGSKIIAIQSTFKIYNKTSTAVEAAVTDQPEGGASAWSEVFAGDFHGCVPLHLSDSKFLRIRPAGGSYSYCVPFKIPTQPVTGESVFVACVPTAPDADTKTMFFRVRLDAKRPVGGHEDNMRIVVSIHPALRIHNVLPYPLQVTVLAGDSKAALASAVTAEGQVEQLHCADLTAPLQMSAATTVYHRAREPVTVYHPESSVSTAKAIELVDEQGCPLQLGVETTTSAWGDLTIVFFAQYIIRNFSTLPLLYAQFARTSIKPSAGQLAPLDSTHASPAQAATPDGAHGERASLQAVYAVFGPRSPFSGKVVMCDPPLADKETITNADQLRGNVALIKRGVVPFTVKARRAAAAGAIGVIFINSDDTTFLAEGDNGPGVRIPCVMLTKSDGEQLASGPAGKFAVLPEAMSTRQRATSQLLEWKRVVKAEVRSLDSHFAFTGTPEKPRSGPPGAGEEEEAEEEELSKEIEFPDAWMEAAGDAPFMFSYDSIDLTGNKVCFCIKGSEWGPPFSLESMGTNGVLQVPGKPSEVPALKGAKPMHEFGMTFELGLGQFSRSKMCSIVPRYTVVNRMGYTLQLVQTGLEAEPNAVMELKDGELTPYHWLDGLKAKTIRARVVPTIGTHESFSTGWSGPLQPEQVGSFAIRFPPEKGSIEDGESLRVLVVVKVRKSAAFVVFRREAEDEPQYAVDNKSSRRVKVWQVGSHPRECGHILHPGNRIPFCWDRPHEQHVIELAQQDCKDTMEVKLDKFGSFRLPGTLKAQALAEGATRTLVVRDAEGSKTASSVAESRAEEQAKYTVAVELAGIGVSVIDAKLEEVLYLGLLDISSSFRNTRTDHEFEFKLGKLQIDNQTDKGLVLRGAGGKGPEIVLAPDSSKSEGRETLHLSMVKSKLYKKMSYFNYFAVFIREMDLDLEETFIMRLLDAAQNVVDSSTITVPEEKTEDLRQSGFRQLKFLRKEWTGGEKMYFEMLQLHPIVVNLSFYGTGAMMQRASTEGGGLSYNPMFAAMKALGVVVTNIDRAPIALNALMLERPFATQQELVSSIRKHYRSQLITQLYKLVGSFEFLGNPVGLVNNLGTGVHDFFYEPAQGLMKSPAEFAKGMSKGSASLFKNMNYGVFNAASKITGSMSKTLVQLSGDEDYIKKRQETQSARLKQTSTNLAQGRQDLANEVSEGFLGIFAKPIAGAKEAGASGFFSGLGKGLLGAVVKPTAGLMDLTSQAAEGVRNTSKSGEAVRRIRPPRVNLGDGILRHYDARSAHGCDAMRRIRDGAWKEHRYIGFCALEGTEAVLVTDKHVCMHNFNTHEEQWEVAVTAITQIAVNGSAVSIVATGSKGGPKSMKCTDGRYAEYLGEAVRRAVSLASTDGRRASGRNSEYML